MAMALALKWERKRIHGDGVRRIEAANEQDVGDDMLLLKP
jgi:hypothetical protein